MTHTIRFRRFSMPRATRAGILRPSASQRSVGQSLVWVMGLVAAVTCSSAFAEGYGELSGLGPAPTGLAAVAFSAIEPVPMPTSTTRRGVAPAPSRTLYGGPSVVWRPLLPAERARMVPIDADLFPHTRRAVPLLVPDAADVTSQSPAPTRAMTGPSVGVRWRIPGYSP